MDPLRLPDRWSATAFAAAVDAFVHLLAAALVLAIVVKHGPGVQTHAAEIRVAAPLSLPRIVFIAGPRGGGGGGGGNRQPAPIRHAEGLGRDAMTLRVAKAIVVADRVRDAEPPLTPQPQGLLLDAKPLASGSVEQIGLPVGGVSYGISTGPGSGGGVGEGVGTGTGPGRGPGFGPGVGGGIGGGVYRVGSGVTAPKLIFRVRPPYTPEALADRIQGSVVLELVVNRAGLPTDIQVVRSLDSRGLDDEAIRAVRQWRFEPGRLAGSPVDVLVTVVLDFSIR